MGTEKGTMVIKLEADLSPIAVGNFVALVECGYYDGVGLPPDRARLRDPGRRSDRHGNRRPRLHDQGRAGHRDVRARDRGDGPHARLPNSVGSQFFIVIDDRPQTSSPSYNTYQIIGHVTAGMDVADAHRCAAGGLENPADPVAMTTVTVANP